MEDPEVSSSEQSGRRCKVCFNVTLGVHFGIDACRACTAFFRRSIAENKDYKKCRTNGKCKIHHTVRNLCKRCRLQKCLEAGMQPESVQGKRDPIVPKYTDPSPLSIVPGSSPEFENRPSSSVSEVHTPYHHESSSVPPPQLLYKSLENYRKLTETERATELSMEPSLVKKLIPLGPLAGLALGTAEHCSKFFRAHIPAIVEFLGTTFDEYSQLDDHEKWTLLRPFLVQFWWMETGYKTYKRIAKEHYPYFFIVTETTYFDVNHADDWVATVPDCPEVFKSGLSDLTRKILQPEKMKSMYLMESLQLKDEEYMGFLALMFWNTAAENQTEKMGHLIARVRSTVFEELHSFHRISGELHPATRFGELMDLYNVAMVEMMRMRETLEFYSALDAFQENDIFSELVKGTPF